MARKGWLGWLSGFPRPAGSDTDAASFSAFYMHRMVYRDPCKQVTDGENWHREGEEAAGGGRGLAGGRDGTWRLSPAELLPKGAFGATRQEGGNTFLFTDRPGEQEGTPGAWERESSLGSWVEGGPGWASGSTCTAAPLGQGRRGGLGGNLGDRLLDAVGLRLGALFLTPDSAGGTETTSR